MNFNELYKSTLYENEIKESIKAHAVECYPEECCGIIANDVYIPMENLAQDKQNDFKLPADVFLNYQVQAIVHSHPDGESSLSESDMVSFFETNVPWGVSVVRESGADSPVFFGEQLDPVDLIGREFRHGQTGTDGKGDCYALIRDYYKTERGITLQDFARSPEWWGSENLYEEHFRDAGFIEVDLDELEDDGITKKNDIQEGDVVMFAVNSDVINHAGVYMGDGLFLHHLYKRLSGREPFGRWKKFSRKVVRYHG